MKFAGDRTLYSIKHALPLTFPCLNFLINSFAEFIIGSCNRFLGLSEVGFCRRILRSRFATRSSRVPFDSTCIEAACPVKVTLSSCIFIDALIVRGVRTSSYKSTKNDRTTLRRGRPPNSAMVLSKSCNTAIVPANCRTKPVTSRIFGFDGKPSALPRQTIAIAAVTSSNHHPSALHRVRNAPARERTMLILGFIPFGQLPRSLIDAPLLAPGVGIYHLGRSKGLFCVRQVYSDCIVARGCCFLAASNSQHAEQAQQRRGRHLRRGPSASCHRVGRRGPPAPRRADALGLSPPEGLASPAADPCPLGRYRYDQSICASIQRRPARHRR